MRDRKVGDQSSSNDKGKRSFLFGSSFLVGGAGVQSQQSGNLLTDQRYEIQQRFPAFDVANTGYPNN